jgi:hypothetical protein
MNAGQPWEELVVEEQPNAKGSTPDAQFRVELLDPLTMCFMHKCGVYLG